MLRRLALKNFVVIRSAEAEFCEGFCALTGETGAGKSLLVDALSLLAGARPAAGATANEGLEIEAAFDISAAPAAAAFLHEHELHSDENEMIVRRIAGGRSRAFINGRQVPLAILAEAVANVADICGQNAHYSLRKAAAQRIFLDDYEDGGESAATTFAAHKKWAAARDQLQTARENAEKSRLRRIALEEEIAELDEIGFTPVKWAEQNRLLTRLSNLEDLAGGGAEVLRLLEDAGEKLSRARRQLADLSRLDDKLAAPMQCAEEGETAAGEAARALSRYADELQTEPAVRENAETFVAAAHRLARKYQLADPALLESLLAEKKSQHRELAAQTGIAALEKNERELHRIFSAACDTLTACRKTAAAALQKKTNALLCKLAMPDANLHIELKPEPTPGARGAEHAEFLISTRKNAPPGALSDVASGGELSRLGLALQIAAGGKRGKPVVVFDEVDAGIGGGAAAVVGALLQTLGESRQVLCVTHLAQVAAHADAHWRIRATNDRGARGAEITKLSEKERIEEIARIVGGAKIGNAARENAADLLQQSRRTK